MNFCNDCGSYMETVAGGLVCPKCRNKLATKIVEINKFESSTPNPVRVVDEEEQFNYIKSDQSCPKCGNKEAKHWVSAILGEHSGISQERVIEHFRCIRCQFSWATSV